MPGQEGIPAVFSPMARTLEDLLYFSKSMIKMKQWKYDHTVHPLEWRDEHEIAVKEQKKLRIGVMRTDGTYHPLKLCPANTRQASSTLPPPAPEPLPLLSQPSRPKATIS